ncbi:TMV resistance protein N isoform X2 [Ziziphus jujuba]|uniref:ADP-ribosyl cyclase/cyclic ADP-ribose hydrolase n=1 Tax=Ziziphus jujuba TaxID=326968 RepID=A0ABM4A4I2_ZIZJJ|nr:TMV resistance protein N isoform X2 [Ziziphus jujuba]
MMADYEASANSSSSSSCKKKKRKKYEVFLSFGGADTRLNFTDHLYHKLTHGGIDTYRDEEKLKRGENISEALLEAIEESRFAVVVLSETYASSSSCLKELAKIVECKKKMGLVVLPVFYGVEPTEVRKQIGRFGREFMKVFKDNVGMVKKWREALLEVANVSGWDLKGRHESEVIDKIVKMISKIVNQFPSHNMNLVGMASREEKVEMLLKIGLEDVRTIGIWGMGGIGKTTLAQQVYSSNFNKFEATAFVTNVREEYNKSGTLIHLQKLLHRQLLDIEGNINNEDMGAKVLRRRLSSIKVLIVLDDVDQLAQVEKLVGNADEQDEWLGPGSRVIVTTTNKDLLKTYGDNNIYEVDKLTDDEALQLLCRKAFKMKEQPPSSDFMKLSKDVVEYADCHPLALEVLGPFLFRRPIDQWQATLAKLRKTPQKDIVSKLRISYDGLDYNQRNIFLDIACFFKGEDEYRVRKILEGCDFNPTIDIEVLVEKSLIVRKGDRLWMHDLLQQLGQDIVRGKHPNDPGKWSRLWLNEDGRNVFVNNRGTQDIEGIFLSLPENREISLDDDPISKMTMLRLLKLRNVKFLQFHGNLSNNLRLLEWHRYPLVSMPSSFQPHELVELIMPNSNIERLWNTTPVHFEKLITINLSYCKYLIQIPDFSKVPNLENLILEGCKRLSHFQPEIGMLKQLILLNLKDCESLKNLPKGINFKSLRTFILSGCKRLNKFPEIVENMDHLAELYLDGTAIQELPMSIKRLTSLTLLKLRDCKNFLSLPDVTFCSKSLKSLDISGCSPLDCLPENLGSLEQLELLDASRTAIREAPLSILKLNNLKTLSFSECSSMARSHSLFFGFLVQKEEHTSFRLPSSFAGLSSLTSLSLSKCNLPEGAIPEDIGCLLSLQYLYLSENDFEMLPKSISKLSNLRELHLDGCKKIRSLPKLPLSIKYVYVYDCPMLNDSNGQLTIWASTEGFSFIDGRKPDNRRGFSYHSLPMPEEHIHILFPKFIKDQIDDEKIFQIPFPYTRIPEWCSHGDTKSSIRIQLPEEGGRAWTGFALFIVFLIQEHENYEEVWDLKETLCHFSTSEGCLQNPIVIDSFKNLKVGSYGLCVYVPKICFAERLNKESHIEASVSTSRPDVELKMCGLHVIFNHEVTMFTQDLVETSTEHLNLKSIKHYMRVLERATKLERSSCLLDFEQKQPEERKCRYRNRPFVSIHLTSKLGSDLQSFLLKIFQGLCVRKHHMFFLFRVKKIVCWFFHQSVGRHVVCYLPRNLFDEKEWVGFCLIAFLTWSPSFYSNNHLDSETPPLLNVHLHSHLGSSIFYITTFTIDVSNKALLLLHVPRKYFGKQLNQCWGVSALFQTNIPDVHVEMCGIQVVHEQDAEFISQMITDFSLSDPNEQMHQQYYDAYSKMANYFLSEVEAGEPETEEKEMSSIERVYESSLQKLLQGTQQVEEQVLTAYEELYVPSETTVLHSKKCFFDSSYQMIRDDSSTDSTGGIIHLQVMAETALYDNDLNKWKKYLEDVLKCLSGHYVFVTLSLKGRIISFLKPFNPISTFDFCFPRKEIIDWFGDYDHPGKQKVEIELPQNLTDDENWMGIAVCAAFSVHEHLGAAIETSFKLLCHLHTEVYCLNPAPMFCVTKDRFKWLFVRGFIWLTYIPRCLLLAELNGKKYIEISIYNECPGLIRHNLSARLMYRHDVEEFRQSITKCMTSLFDNMDCIRRFVDDESQADEIETSTDHYGNSYNVDRNQRELIPRTSGLDFDADMIYSSCFPPSEILDWFNSQSSINGCSVTIQLPSNVYNDGDFLGLALCAYFSELEHPLNTSSINGNFDPEMPHHLVCHLELEVEGNRVGIETLHHHRITNKELNKLHHDHGEFMWLSYISRNWLSNQLNDSSLIEASFASDKGWWRAHKCGLCLVYNEQVEEFQQRINHCMALLG